MQQLLHMFHLPALADMPSTYFTLDCPFFPFQAPTPTHTCPRSSNAASAPACPSFQQSQQYKSPAQPVHRTRASSQQMMHHESISVSVKSCDLGLAGARVGLMVVGVEGRSRGTDGKMLSFLAVAPSAVRGRDTLVATGASVDSGEAGVRGGDGLTDSSSRIRCNCAAASSSSFADDVVEVCLDCLPMSSRPRSEAGFSDLFTDGSCSPFLSLSVGRASLTSLSKSFIWTVSSRCNCHCSSGPRSARSSSTVGEGDASSVFDGASATDLVSSSAVRRW